MFQTNVEICYEMTWKMEKKLRMQKESLREQKAFTKPMTYLCKNDIKTQYKI